MKLRFEPNTVKFRLTSTEINFLQQNKSLKQEIFLPGNESFSYQILEVGENCELTLEILKNSITATISSQSLNDWITSGQVGISKEFYVKDDVKFTLVIEKDLPRRKKK